MDDQCRRGDARQPRSTAAIGEDREQLALYTARVAGARLAAGGEVGKGACRARRIGKGCQFEHPDIMRNGVGFVARCHELAAQRRRGTRQATRAAGRHDRGQAERAFRGACRDNLGNHAAHRHADNMGTRKPECIEQCQRVIRHVGQRIGWFQPDAEHLRADGDGEVSHRRCVEVRRQPDVAIVEADDAKAAFHQIGDKVGRPGDYLAAQPHDEQDSRCRRVTCVFKVQVDAIGGDLRHSGLRLADMGRG